MTIYFNSHDIQVYRRRRKGSSDRYGMSVTLTVTQADIQPATLERTQASEGRIGAVYDAFVDNSIDIKEGDQIVDTATQKRYSVKGVTTWEGAGLLDHKELTLQAVDG